MFFFQSIKFITTHGNVDKDDAPRSDKAPFYEIKASGKLVDKDTIPHMLRGLHFDLYASGKALEKVVFSFKDRNKCVSSNSVSFF